MKKSKQNRYASRVGVSVIGNHVFSQKRKNDEARPIRINTRWGGSSK